jgi:hypothetical protein
VCTPLGWHTILDYIKGGAGYRRERAEKQGGSRRECTAQATNYTGEKNSYAEQKNGKIRERGWGGESEKTVGERVSSTGNYTGRKKKGTK